MKRILVLGIVIGAAYVGWRAWRGSSENERIFYGRVWIDHEPSTRTETFKVFGTIRKEPIGWFADRAAWKGAWEGFRYEPRGDGQIEVLFPHSGKKVRMTYRAWKCDDKNFDYCLELSGGGASTLYYSKRNWTRASSADEPLDAELAAGIE